MAKPFIAFPAGTVQFAVRGMADGIPIAVVSGARFNAGAATAADGLSLAEAILTSFAANVGPSVPSTTVYEECYVRDMSTQFGWEATAVDSIVGSAGDTAVPNNVALVVTLGSTVVGRSFRGRTFWAGLGRSTLANQVSWLSSAVTHWQGVSTDIAGDITTAGWTQCILSRQVNGTRRVDGVATPVSSFRGSARIASLRKRLR